MRVKISDSIVAGLLAAGLMGIAAGVAFAIPHGFEAGIGWFVFLFPGPITDALRFAHPAVGNFIFRTLLLVISFAWYFAICFLGAKMYRFTRKF